MTDREAKGSAPLDEEPSSSDWKLCWRRLFEFGKNILQLERHASCLFEENERLRSELREMQRQVDELSGEMKTLSSFVTETLNDRIDAEVEKAEIRAFERLLSVMRDSSANSNNTR